MAVVYAFEARRFGPQPWQNHELAELYRAVDILSNAGLAVETDMGLSDEGDPWFVFCRADTGDVLVHFARVDGQFIAASIVVNETFRGHNFRGLIDQIVQRHPLVVPPASTGSKLYLHPAVVFTAFIAAALLFSHHADADTIAPSVAIDVAKSATGAGHGEGGLTAALRHFFADSTHAAPALRQAAPSESKLKALLENTDASFSLASLIAIAIAAIEPSFQAPVGDLSVLLTLDSAPAPVHDGASGPTTGTGQLDLPALVDFTSGSHKDASVLNAEAAPPPVEKSASSELVVQAGAASLASNPHPHAADAEAPLVRDVAPAPAAVTVLADAVLGHILLPVPVQATAATATQATTQAAVSTIPAFLLDGYQTFDGYQITNEAVQIFVTGNGTHSHPPSGDGIAGKGTVTQPAQTPLTPTDSLPVDSHPQPSDPSAGVVVAAPSTPVDQPVVTPAVPVSSTPVATTPAAPVTTPAAAPPDTPPSTPAPVTSVGGGTDTSHTAPTGTPDSVSSPGSGTVAVPSGSGSSPATSHTTPDPTPGFAAGTGGLAAPGQKITGTAVHDPNAVVDTLAHYPGATQNQMTGTLKATDVLSLMISEYSSVNPGPLQLVVFDSKDATYPVFPFMKGVLFVEDTEFAAGQSLKAPSGNFVTVDLANGGTMTLIGVINADHVI